MSNPALAGLSDFFDKIWGDNEGYARIWVRETGLQGRVKTFMPHVPEKKDAIYRLILKWAATEGTEIFFSPALYSKPSSKSEVLGSNVAWAEFDGNFPDEWPEHIAPKPSVEIRSSADKNRHVYWLLDEFVGPKKLERLNRALAYALGADLSGWDASQLLRPPFSTHRKHKPITVKVVADRTELAPYPMEAFSGVPEPAEVIRESVDIDTLPSMDEVRALAKWDKDLLDLFKTSAKEAKGQGWDRSGALARVAYKGCELGWEDSWIMVALLDADDRWEKYKRRQTRTKILEELINRARAKVGYNVDSEDIGLLSHLKERVVDEEDELPDFLSISQINAIPGRDDWLVEGLLTREGLGLATGRPGTGKTQLMLQLGADLACGRKTFADTFPLSGETKKVLFLSLEMSHYQLQHFTTKLVNTYHEPELDKNLVVYGRGEPVYFTEEAGQRLIDGWLDEHAPDVVIVDSLSQSATNISDDDEMKELFGFLKTLRRYHKFGLIFIHHHRKKANDAASRKQANSQSDIYGSYQIAASVDFALDLEDRNDESGGLEMKLLKARFRHTGDMVMLHRDGNLHFTVNEIVDLANQHIDDPGKNGDDHEGAHLGVG